MLVVCEKISAVRTRPLAAKASSDFGTYGAAESRALQSKVKTIIFAQAVKSRADTNRKFL
jgi:hypothetical protein